MLGQARPVRKAVRQAVREKNRQLRREAEIREAEIRYLGSNAPLRSGAKPMNRVWVVQSRSLPHC